MEMSGKLPSCLDVMIRNLLKCGLYVLLGYAYLNQPHFMEQFPNVYHANLLKLECKFH